MTTQTEPVDRSDWPPGPWDGEPDRVEFEHAGRPCLLVRQPRGGFWCGYAAVDPGHPLHGVEYDNARVPVDVHGEPTYSGECDGPICHEARPGKPDGVWWFGFDCAHSGDMEPANLMPCPGCEYRTVEYVRRETERLAEQLAAMTKDSAGS